MKRFVRGVQVAGILVLGATSMWAVKSFTTRFFSADHFVFNLNGSFSEQQKGIIKEFLSQDESFKKVSLSDLDSTVRDRFPSLEKVSLSQNATGAITVNAHSVRPLLNIGVDLVLAHGGKLFKKFLFDQEILSQLERIDFPIFDSNDSLVDMQQPELVGTLSEELVATIKKLPSQLFKDYEVSCQEQAKWWLQDKQEKKFYVLFNGVGMPTERNIAACNKIKGTLGTRGVFTAKRTKGFVADVRFEDQVILFRKTRGR